MSLRAKIVAVILTAVALMWALSAYLFVRGERSVEGLLRERVQMRAAQTSTRVDAALRDYEADLLELAEEPKLRAYVATAPAAPTPPPEEVRAVAVALLANGDGHLISLTCLGAGGLPLFRAWNDAPESSRAAVKFQTSDFITSGLRADEGVWNLKQPVALRSQATQEPYGSGVRATVPVFAAETGDAQPSGALVLEVHLDALCAWADSGMSSDERTSDVFTSSLTGAEIVLALDNLGRVVYHTNALLRNRPADEALPYLRAVREKIARGERGEAEYDDAPNGDHWIAALSPVEGTNVTVAAAANQTRADAELRRAGLTALVLVLLLGVSSVALIYVIATRAARRITRVAEGAAAIARGDLESRVRVDASGETRLLAESFNLMGERLREHIRRESESRQFESFMRISAMLTHDLKNAITSLSMLVNNMERLFDREEFRKDAVASVRDATEKLKRVVARLNEPAISLSGEYRRHARQTDLVPIIKRALAMNAFPTQSLEIETQLPDALMATVEAERIENVIENLVINAVEAMGEKGGRLTVEAGTLKDGLIFFSVADTGPGMNEEFIRTRLFRPFMTTKDKGIGLGLFTCRAIVEAHGGRLDFESHPGVGTRFRVVLPSALFQSRERQERAEKTTSDDDLDERDAS